MPRSPRDDPGCGARVRAAGRARERHHAVTARRVDGVVSIFRDHVPRDDVGGRAKCARAGVPVGE